MNFIHTENIEYSWGTKQILKRVSIDAEEGKFIGVIGPNGSGKSTFLKCVYRVWQQYGGIVDLDGKNTAHMSYRETALLLGVVAQHNTYDFDFSEKDDVLMGRSPHKSFAELSGGELQRVILAIALAQKTKGLILDDPTNHLDIKYQLQLLNTVKQIGQTVLAAFHDLNIAALYCDSIYVMKDGCVYAYGTPSEVLTEKLIREVYNVETQIIVDNHGNPHIIYIP